MIIAVGSGKGGTGKTTIAVALARVLARAGLKVSLADCDVEAPNAHLFLNPQWNDSRPVMVPEPIIDKERCTNCGACAEFCRFNALAVTPELTMTFPELCHACGGCRLVCPEGAIRYSERQVGQTRTGTTADGLRFIEGRIKVGVARATPAISAVRERMPAAPARILDAPPGTSCPFVESLQDADICLLVAEPTRFGVHDLGLALEVTRDLDIPRAILVNRSDLADMGPLRRLADESGTEILLTIPHDRAIAAAYASGGDVLAARPGLAEELLSVWRRLSTMAGKEVGT